MTQFAIEKAKRPFFTRQEAAFWAECEGPALDGLLKRAVNAGELMRYRRGYYGLASRYVRNPVHPFSLAQQMHGPSYLSLESALSHHGWIPEAVYAITSAIEGRSRSFDTPLGLFSYTRIPQNKLYAGVRQEISSDGGAFLVATPLKSLADFIYVHRPNGASLPSLRESLRIEDADWKTLDIDMVEELVDVYRDPLVLRFLEAVAEEVKK